MTHYFDATAPYAQGRLETADNHSLYWERCGAPGGLPLIFLHGGPGSGCAPKHRQWFDPERFDVVLLDQRGAGRSTPHCELAGNTTQALITDIERLREHLGIEAWIVVGPSWGSTLSLAYAQTHPGRVSGLVVEGIFLGSPDELAWMHGPGGVRSVFPDAWQDFIAPVPEALHDDQRAVMDWCFEQMKQEIAEGCPDLAPLSDPNASLSTLRRSTLYRWTEYEDRLSYLEHSPEAVRDALRAKGADFVAAHSLIEAHYFTNGCFLEPGQLLANAGRLDGIPMHILQSRYDMVCPARSAFRLAKACPHAGFHLVPVNGHGMTETTQPYLNAIMDDLANRLG